MTSEESPYTVIDGEYTTAVVFISEENLEDSAREQIQEMVNHPAFRNQVRVMPDAHYGAGCVIGFTMPLTNRVSPNVVGVDEGCGLHSFKLADVPFDITDESDLLEIDELVRDAVPMAYNTHSGGVYHVGEKFPWDEFAEKWGVFAENHLDSEIPLGEYHPDEFDPDVEFYKDLCAKVGYNINDGINSVGTLGKGNHFIEFSISESDGSLWCTIHSGSRGLGATITEYHQERAEKLRKSDTIREFLNTEIPEDYHQYIKFDMDTVSDEDLLDWLQGGMGESFVDYDLLEDTYGGTDEASRISEIGNELKEALTVLDESEGDELAYLEGSEAVEYYVDLAFGQTYASENRKTMAKLIADVLDAQIVDEIEAVHNYIDYEDGIIRKGATPANEGQRAVIPMNMAEGVLVVEGKGNPDWNYSVCHGAGRTMSRNQARDELSKEALQEWMEDVVSTELPIEESPDAYKETALIERSITPSVEIVDKLKPILNLKAPETSYY